MRKTILTFALPALLLAATSTMAEQAPATGRPAQDTQAAPDIAAFDKQAEQIRQHMKTMQDEMDKIRQTQDPQARQKLLQEHWTTMQSTMEIMGDMCCGQSMMGSGGSMMGDGHMMSGHMMGMMGDYTNLTPEQMKQRQYMMGQYMGLQQMMMNQMMMHQHYMSPQ